MSEISINTLKTMLANLDDAKKYQSLRDVMETLPAPDLAAVFEDLPAEKLPVLFRLCPKDLAADVFTELTPATQQKLIDGLTDTELKAVVDELCVDDATDLVEEMPANVVKRILSQADPATRRMINELLQYPEDSAGGVMTTELMELRPDMTVAQAMEAIRQNGFDKETINNCYVTDGSRKLVGVVSLRALVLAKDTAEPIRDLMDTNVVSVTTTTDQEDVSHLFEKYGFLAIPVVDAENRLVGIVTIDDAISILQDEASEDIAKMNAIGPSDKPYFKQSMWDLYKSRAPWLLFLMISATFSSMVIRGFEDALAAVTVLTAYIPMLTDAGGNAGSHAKNKGKHAPENFYHGLVLGLIVSMRKEYRIVSNRESGEGRYDIAIYPFDKTKDAYILEFKVLNEHREKTVQETAQNALKQIQTRNYEADLLAYGIPADHIYKLGFGFLGKKVWVVSDPPEKEEKDQVRSEWDNLRFR